MTKKSKPFRFMLSAAALTVVLCALPTAAATYTVTNANDSGLGSFRQKINAANAHVGQDIIAFNIPGQGVHTIALGSDLPAITDAVIIDGYTQPGSHRNTLPLGDNAVLLIELRGSPDRRVGLAIDSGTTVQGLIINGFSAGYPYFGTGIKVAGSNNKIRGNFIGTDATGTRYWRNEIGVYVKTKTIIANNNIIGGTNPGARNVISGNTFGVMLGVADGSSGNRVQGNFIGTDVTGTKALGNLSGVGTKGSNYIIGGTEPGACNIISGNIGWGIGINGGAVVQGNYIGTDVTGTKAVGNGDPDRVGQWELGIIISNDHNGTERSTIGGIVPEARNVISGNGADGILIQRTAARNNIQGNYIGTDKSGSRPLPNGGSGILLDSYSNDNTIGSSTRGAGNTIAFNLRHGVLVGSGAVRNRIVGNSIFANQELGINLRTSATYETLDDGVTANDGATSTAAPDSDEGANNLQNFPVLTSAVTDSDSRNTTIRGTLDSTPGKSFRIEFFSNPACDESGHGEGKFFIGAITVSTDDAGHADIIYVRPVAMTAGRVVTATATNPSGNTSEFSACVTVNSAPSSTAVVARAISAGASG